MAHYFTNEKNLKSNEKTFNINIKDNNYQFITDEGVFSKEYLDLEAQPARTAPYAESEDKPNKSKTPTSVSTVCPEIRIT